MKKQKALIPDAVPATEEDWGREYLDYILSVKVVGSVEEAIAHINRYNTKHSEAIITNNYTNAQKFLDEVDAAAVYVNGLHPLLLTGSNSDTAPRSASVPKSFMREVPWDFWH